VGVVFAGSLQREISRLGHVINRINMSEAFSHVLVINDNYMFSFKRILNKIKWFCLIHFNELFEIWYSFFLRFLKMSHLCIRKTQLVTVTGGSGLCWFVATGNIPIYWSLVPCLSKFTIVVRYPWAKTTPTCYCYKLCFTYTKMWHLSVLSFSTILPPKGLRTCY
jgi:hypothetical protein